MNILLLLIFISSLNCKYYLVKMKDFRKSKRILNEIKYGDYGNQAYESSESIGLKNENAIPDIFEGDIILSDADKKKFRKTDGTIPKRKNAIIEKDKKWPLGVVPYEISEDFPSEVKESILQKMDEFHNKTCLEFVSHTNEEDFVSIEMGEKNSSPVGRHGGKQVVTLTSEASALHELMHSIGFWHEQSREDRDDYITVLKNNIQDDKLDNFKKYSLKEIDHLGAKYDYCSIMHYGPGTFAKVYFNILFVTS